VPRSLHIPMPEPVQDALWSLAEREWRAPRDQGLVLILEGLRTRNLLPDSYPAPDLTPQVETAHAGAE
jgi:hypothetical protein